jgi:hypothetical protein
VLLVGVGVPVVGFAVMSLAERFHQPLLAVITLLAVLSAPITSAHAVSRHRMEPWRSAVFFRFAFASGAILVVTIGAIGLALLALAR